MRVVKHLAGDAGRFGTDINIYKKDHMSSPASYHPPDISGFLLIPELHWGRWISVAIICLLIGLIARAFAVGDIGWPHVAQFLTAQSIIDGLINTITMSVAAMALGIVLGVAAAIMRISDNPVLRGVAIGYSWLFRGPR